MQHDDDLQKFNFDLWPNPQGERVGGRVRGVCGQNICYHVAALCNMIMFWKCLILTFRPQQQGRGCLRAKYLLPCYCIWWFPLIWYTTWPCSEKVKYWPIDPIPRIRGYAGKIFAIMLLHLWFSLDMQHDHVLEKFNFDLSTPIAEPRVGVCGQNIFYHAAAFGDSLYLICIMTMFRKRQTILTHWPYPKDQGECGQNICYHVAALVILFRYAIRPCFEKKNEFRLFDPNSRAREGSAGTIIATMLLHLGESL